ncbi:hypothetical protein C7M61_001788 [Candidozyma pseudohaemuli]|uniref:Uncharacterized protein n=1 Tax=Candidozyma pseudohaemuli TaxID=418784 RepID=A0A2P7YTB5_9ASCO|nr:hypothetical protein C7M61_001788 [[Candida] pseudohaemulonii]PSK39185.1 hypothetical protein C7M61_001788 [[Candida] pseudohaemulonii]
MFSASYPHKLVESTKKLIKSSTFFKNYFLENYQSFSGICRYTQCLLNTPPSESYLPGDFHFFRAMLNEKPQENYLPEAFPYFRRSAKETPQTFLPGDSFNYEKVKTKRRSYFPGCFYFYRQIVKNDVLEVPYDVYLPGDFGDFYESWTTETIEASSQIFNYESVGLNNAPFLQGDFAECFNVWETQAESFLPGDFKHFFTIWTKPDFPIEMSNSEAFLPGDFPFFFRTWTSTPKTNKTFFPKDFFFFQDALKDHPEPFLPNDFFFWKNITRTEEDEIYFPKQFFFWQGLLSEGSKAFASVDLSGISTLWKSGDSFLPKAFLKSKATTSTAHVEVHRSLGFLRRTSFVFETLSEYDSSSDEKSTFEKQLEYETSESEVSSFDEKVV